MYSNAELTSSSPPTDPQQLLGDIASLGSQLEEARDETELNLLMLQQEQLQRAEALIQALLERLEQQG